MTLQVAPPIYSSYPDVGRMTKAEALAEKDRCIAAANDLLDNHGDDTGNLSAEYQAEFNKLCERSRVCGTRAINAQCERFANATARTSVKPNGIEADHARLLGDGSDAPQSGSAAFVNVKTGEKVYALAHGDRVSGGNVGGNSQWQLGGGNANRLSVGETVRQLALGEGGSPEFAANITGSDAGGGYLTSETFSRDVLDLARSASVVSRAGALTVPMDTNALHMARLTQDATAYWRQEGEAVTSSDLAFDRVTLRPHTVAAITTLSVELLEDATNAAAIVENSITQALGLALDRAALFGTGAEAEPLGLFNTTGVNAETSVGTPDDYAEVTSAIRQILTANYAGDVSALAWLGHPRDFATFDGLTDTTGQPLRPTPWASQLRPLSTTSFSITEGGAGSSMAIGDFSQMILGMRTSGVRLEVFRDGSVTDGSSVTHNALAEMKVHIRAYLRADVAVMRPTWFTKLTGVTAA